MKKFDLSETGKRIKYCRQEKNLTQKELAGKLGVSTNTVCQYEKGQSGISLEILYYLVLELETSSDYLLGLSDS